MKKKIILSLLIVLALFVITGCGKSDSKGSSSDNLHKLEFVDMRYNEPKNYSKKEPIDMDGNKVLVFRFHEDDNKSIGLYYYKNKCIGSIIKDGIDLYELRQHKIVTDKEIVEKLLRSGGK